jgi:hypothetical protein
MDESVESARSVNNKEHSKILILDGHSKAAAAAVLALPARSELHVAATEEDCLCFASHRIARKLAQPRAVAELRTWIEQLDRDENFDLIIPSTEASLLAVKPDDLDPALQAWRTHSARQSHCHGYRIAGLRHMANRHQADTQQGRPP